MTAPINSYRVAIAFELCTEAQGLVTFSRPQDFRVKDSRWQYVELTFEQVINNLTYHWHVYAYARRWKGPGSNFDELKHEDHPTADEIVELVMNFSRSNGFPIGSPDRKREPMGWNDPLNEDDFLDESDNPADFKYWDADDENEDYFFDINDDPSDIDAAPEMETEPPGGMDQTRRREKAFAEITAAVMSDQTTYEVAISIMQAWLALGAIRLGADVPGIHEVTSNALRQIADLIQAPIVDRYPESVPLFDRPPTLPMEEFNALASVILADKQPILVALSIAQQWLLVSAVQAATRHPQMDEFTKRTVTEMARQFQANIVHWHPGAGELMEMGWNPAYDYRG